MGLSGLANEMDYHAGFAVRHGWGACLVMELRTHPAYAAAHHLTAMAAPQGVTTPVTTPVTTGVTPPVTTTTPPVTPTGVGGPSPTTQAFSPTVTVGSSLDTTVPNGGLSGSNLTYIITPQPLPANMTFNRGTGELVFAPAPGQVGTHNFTVVVSDGTRSVTEKVPLTVTNPVFPSTEISGQVVDESGSPLAGIEVMVGSAMTMTDKSGAFTLTGVPATPGSLTVDGLHTVTVDRMMVMGPTDQFMGHPLYANANNVNTIGLVGGAAGVAVDADGVLRTQFFADQTGQLSKQRIAAAKAALNPQLAKANTLRKISLTRLEKILRERLDNNQKPTDEMRYLAGLMRVQYVFYYPESKDIVIAGPAEGWVEDLAGRKRGITSAKPVIELQDLITALRCFAPDAKPVPLIGCSIDPTKEGLANMQQFLQTVGSRATPNDTQFIVDGLRKSLGLQNVTVNGVPTTTHFAQVLVEADYRMKLIGIGLETSPVKMTTYIDKATPAGVGKNALQRWYFVPDYKCVRVGADQNAMELVGEGVQLVAALEQVSADGVRQNTTNVDAASKAWVDSFTREYPKLSALMPVYGQLRNCIDLAVAAAFIKQQGYHAKAGWEMTTFRDEKAFPVETESAPKKVETAVNAIWRGNHLMTPVGGGVHIEPSQALKPGNMLEDTENKVGQMHDKLKVENLANGQWWWD